MSTPKSPENLNGKIPENPEIVSGAILPLTKEIPREEGATRLLTNDEITRMGTDGAGGKDGELTPEQVKVIAAKEGIDPKILEISPLQHLFEQMRGKNPGAFENIDVKAGATPNEQNDPYDVTSALFN